MYIQRHGESKANAQRVYTATKLNPSLTVTGRRQIESHLDFYETTQIDRIVTSPLKRAVETGEIIAGRLGLKTTVDDLLYEVELGDLEGQSMDEPENIRIFAGTLENWLKGDKSMRFANGESFTELKKRLDYIEQNYMQHKNVLLVAHATLFACLMGQKVTYDETIFELFLPRGGRGFYNGKDWTMIDKRAI